MVSQQARDPGLCNGNDGDVMCFRSRRDHHIVATNHRESQTHPARCHRLASQVARLLPASRTTRCAAAVGLQLLPVLSSGPRVTSTERGLRLPGDERLYSDIHAQRVLHDDAMAGIHSVFVGFPTVNVIIVIAILLVN